MAASPKYPTTDEMIRELWDRQQISDVMLRFGRGLDLHDWDMYAATLTDPFEVDFFDLTGRFRPDRSGASDDDTESLGGLRQRLPAAADRHAPIFELPHQPAWRRR
jgi:hypothetical protein